MTKMIKNEYEFEPMRTEIKKIDGVNVLFQYDKVVPSFDTWNKKEETRTNISLNGSWKFSFDPHNVGVSEEWFNPNYDDSNWKCVTIPSSWDLYEVVDFEKSTGAYGEGTPFTDGYAWFKTTFEGNADWKNKTVRLNFLGVNYRSWVFINGHLVEAHEGGHTYFSLDITPYLNEGSNQLVVRVYRRPWYTDYKQSNQEDKIFGSKEVPGNLVDYWPYAGITRDVYLEVVNKVNIAKILTSAYDHKLELYAVLENNDSVDHQIKLVFNSGNNTGGSEASEELTIKANEIRVIKKTIDIKEAKAWSHVCPNLYTACVSVYEDGLRDTLSCQYGMREVKINGSTLCLNGKQLFLKGVNWHEETAKSGRSMKKVDYDTEFGLMKELGFNFIRNSHYNKHPYAYEYADQFGFLMADETENMWLSKEMIDYQYSTYKLSRALVMMTTWNNMNHPSIIIWSLLNEPDNSGTHYVDFVKELKEVTYLLDLQKRPVSSGHFKGGDDPAAEVLDILGWNEYFGAFGGWWEDVNKLSPSLEAIHQKFPNKPIMITENGSWSSFGHKGDENSGELWQAKRFEENYNQVTNKADYMLGYTYWVFKDYKTRAGYVKNANGLSTMGIVPFQFDKEWMDEMKRSGKEFHKEVFHRIKKATNPIEYKED